MSLVVSLDEVFAAETGLLAKHASWERVELGEVCNILNGFPFKSSLFTKVEGFPLIRIRDIANSSTETFYSGEFPPEYVVKKGDLLIGMDGNFRCCEWLGCDAGLNQRVCKITPNDKLLHRKFLLYGLGGYLKAIEDVTSSVTVGHLSSRDVQRIPFPLPPFDEQRRIVAKLEALLAKVDTCQHRLAKIPILLKRFRQSVLAAACSGRLTADWREENPQVPVKAPLGLAKRLLPEVEEDEILYPVPPSWHWCRLGTIASFINGDRGKNYPNKNEYVADGIPFINTGHIQPDGSLSAESMHYLTREKFDSLRSGKINPGDLVYCLRGATLGKTAFVAPYAEGAVASSLVIIRVDSAVDRRFVYFFLTSPYGKTLVDRFDNGSAQPNLGADSVKRYVFPLSPPAEQHEIVRRVETLFSLADQIEARFTKAKQQVDKLTPSLLAKAFRGELVPQDPNDEPASKLLDRLKRKNGN